MSILIQRAVQAIASSTDKALVRWNSTTGQFVLNSTGILSDAGALTGLTSIVLGDITWSSTDSIVSTSTMSLTANGDLTINTGPSASNINMVAFNGNINAVASGVVSFAGSDVDFISTPNNMTFTSATSMTLTASSGSITLSPSTTVESTAFLHFNDNLGLKLGTSSSASLIYDGTNVVFNPKLAGSGALVLGSSSSSADADLIINKLALGNSPISANAYINGVITGPGRGVLNFVLTFTGGGTSAAVSIASFIDQGTNVNLGAIGYLSQVRADASNHTTSSTYTGFSAQMGYTSNFSISTGTHISYGTRIDMSAFGVGGTITGGTFRRYGIVQEAITAMPGTPASDLIMGAFFNNSLNLVADQSLFFDSTSTVLGDTGIKYVTANTDLEVTVDGTLTFVHDNDKNVSKKDFKLDTVGSGLYVKEGTNATMGVATLVAGTVVVNTTKVTANSRIFLTHNTSGGTVGAVSVSARTAGTSFTITSLNVLDTSQVAWLIMEPA